MIKAQHSFTREDISNEIRAIRRICTTGHANVVQVLCDWQEDVRGVLTTFVVMELMDMNYATFLDKYCDEVDFWDDWFRNEPAVFGPIEMMKGLVFIHGMDEIHRDLKPANGNPRKSLLD